MGVGMKVFGNQKEGDRPKHPTQANMYIIQRKKKLEPEKLFQNYATNAFYFKEFTYCLISTDQTLYH